MDSGGSSGGARGAHLPLFLDQTEARRTGPLLFKGVDDRAPPPPPPASLSQGMDPALFGARYLINE